MFENMKAMGAIAGLMKNKERLREMGEEFREKLSQMSAEGSAGGGAVRVTVSGQLRVLAVFLDPAVIAGLQVEGAGGKQMIETLIQEATNEAISRIQVMVSEEARRMAAELGLPDMPGLEKLIAGGGA
ncbi:MAG: YbaB/EbfC family nucleoid-associated protein [Phycisphaerales bacterium]|jgi:DNA-binding YbaB/EbfC family protein